jgi:hypothetical protein
VEHVLQVGPDPLKKLEPRAGLPRPGRRRTELDTLTLREILAVGVMPTST